MSTLKTDVLKDVAETVTVNVVDIPNAIALRVDLANTSDPAKGAGLVGYSGRTLRTRLKDRPIIDDYSPFKDGVTSDSAALLSLSQNVGRVFLGVGNYFIGTTVTCATANVEFIGVKGKTNIIWPDGVIPFNVTAAGVKFKDITFSPNFTTGVVAPSAISYSDATGDADVRGCTFNNSTLRILNSTNALYNNVKVIDNIFTADFSGFDIVTTQNDVLVVRGYEDVVVERNHFTVTNVHRVIKIQASTFAFTDDYADATTSPRRVVVKGNKFFGSTTSDKQVIDLFTVQRCATFIQGNNFNVSGFNVILENKTNKSNSASNISTDIIEGNSFASENKAIHIEAMKGNTTSGGIFALGRRTVIVRGNTFYKQTAAVPAGFLGYIMIRYCKAIVVGDNDFINIAGSNQCAAFLSSSDKITFTGNNVDGGWIHHADSTGSSQGDTHSATSSVIEVTGNNWEDCSNPLQGFVVARGIASPSGSLVVSGNSASNDVVTAAAGGLLVIRDATLYAISVTGNSLKQQSSVDERVMVAGTNTITKYSERGNTWNDNRGSAVFDPPSLVDGAGVSTSVTVTGAALGDYAEASFSLSTQGITMTADVTAANTVTVRFQNETASTIDLGSGTLTVRTSRQAVI